MGQSRLPALDWLRGLIMTLMALDHANGFIAHGKLDPEMWAGLFPEYGGDGLAFLTRAVTHLAAPGFFFLMGAGMALFAANKRESLSQPRILLHFIGRGLLLILLQFILENPAWRLGGTGPGSTYIGVLFALGGGMILGGLALLLPSPWLVVISAVTILGVEASLPDSQVVFAGNLPLMLLLAPGFAPLEGSVGIFVLYPVIPWLGVVGLGITYGRWLHKNSTAAVRFAAWMGLAAISGFFLLRLLGSYGNIRPAGGDWIQFFNLVKYPPSITFLLAALGINLALMGLWSRLPEKIHDFSGPLIDFGRVPLFFYFSHLYLYAWIGVLLGPGGANYWLMILFWIAGLLLLYPLCRMYRRIKTRFPLLAFL